MAKTVKAIADSITVKTGGEIISTEELKRLIEDTNNKVVEEVAKEHHPRKNKIDPVQNNGRVLLNQNNLMERLSFGEMSHD